MLRLVHACRVNSALSGRALLVGASPVTLGSSAALLLHTSSFNYLGEKLEGKSARPARPYKPRRESSHGSTDDSNSFKSKFYKPRHSESKFSRSSEDEGEKKSFKKSSYSSNAKGSPRSFEGRTRTAAPRRSRYGDDFKVRPNPEKKSVEDMEDDVIVDEDQGEKVVDERRPSWKDGKSFSKSPRSFAVAEKRGSYSSKEESKRSFVERVKTAKDTAAPPKKDRYEPRVEFDRREVAPSNFAPRNFSNKKSFVERAKTDPKAATAPKKAESDRSPRNFPPRDFSNKKSFVERSKTPPKDTAAPPKKGRYEPRVEFDRREVAPSNFAPRDFSNKKSFVERAKTDPKAATAPPKKARPAPQAESDRNEIAPPKSSPRDFSNKKSHVETVKTAPKDTTAPPKIAPANSQPRDFSKLKKRSFDSERIERSPWKVGKLGPRRPVQQEEAPDDLLSDEPHPAKFSSPKLDPKTEAVEPLVEETRSTYVKKQKTAPLQQNIDDAPVVVPFRAPMDYDDHNLFDKFIFGDVNDTPKKRKEKKPSRQFEKTPGKSSEIQNSDHPQRFNDEAPPIKVSSLEKLLKKKVRKVEGEAVAPEKVEKRAAKKSESRALVLKPTKAQLREDGTVRLNKFLIDLGNVGSRAQIALMVHQGKVLVNGVAAQSIGQPLTASDQVEIEIPEVEYAVYAFNKPVGLLSAPTGFGSGWSKDWLPNQFDLWNVGRLDKDSSGLLILTNDGWLTGALIHSEGQIEKEYLVETEMALSDEQLYKMAKGVNVLGERSLPAKVQRVAANKFRIILSEGKNRQIRRMVRTVGGEVKELHRSRIGDFLLPDSVKFGYFKRLTRGEIFALLAGRSLIDASDRGHQFETLERWAPSSLIDTIGSLRKGDVDGEDEGNVKVKKPYYERRKEAMQWKVKLALKAKRMEAKEERRKDRISAKQAKKQAND